MDGASRACRYSVWWTTGIANCVRMRLVVYNITGRASDGCCKWALVGSGVHVLIALELIVRPLPCQLVLTVMNLLLYGPTHLQNPYCASPLLFHHSTNVSHDLRRKRSTLYHTHLSASKSSRHNTEKMVSLQPFSIPSRFWFGEAYGAQLRELNPRLEI
jgi:hypothetical protein